jgi:hypothetical protein
MNGRVYDPELGRFLSPDPNVQFVADLQSYNRYSYAANNPLRYADPTGYFFSGTFDFLVNIGISIAAIGICAGSEGAGCTFAFSMLAAIYNTTSAVHAGQGWGQAIETSLMGMAVGGVVGGFSAITGAGALPLKYLVISGAVSGAVSSAMMNLTLSGGKGLGMSMLTGAASGAAGAALAWAIQGAMAVSQASAAEQQGGGGSGADQVEVIAVRRSTQADSYSVAGGSPGSLSVDDLDRIVSGNVANGSNMPSAGLSDREVANVLFNETRSFSAGDDPTQLTEGRENVAHAIMNGDRREMASGIPRPLAASTVAHVPPQEQARYDACLDAVKQARAADVDPTHAAVHFNFRNNDSQGAFMGFPVQTNNGPVFNGYAGGGLGTHVWINTYD